MNVETIMAMTDDDGRALLAAAETDWERPVPQCPEWDSAGLVRHMGGVFSWMSDVVNSGTRVSFGTMAPPPEQSDALSPWYRRVMDRTLEVLRSADPASETWTFSSTGDHRVAWWRRRVAVEVAIHRWDAEQARAVDGGTPPRPVNGEVAAAGVDEFIVEFLPRLLAKGGVDGVSGTLDLRASDEPTRWWIDLDAPGSAAPVRQAAETTIRGPRSDLLLWLNNRGPLDALEVVGHQAILAGWSQLAF